MAKNTFFNSFENEKKRKFRPTWTLNCGVIIEYMKILIILSDFSLNFVSDRVLKHVPTVKNDQNMLILKFDIF